MVLKSQDILAQSEINEHSPGEMTAEQLNLNVQTYHSAQRHRGREVDMQVQIPGLPQETSGNMESDMEEDGPIPHETNDLQEIIRFCRELQVRFESHAHHYILHL